MEFSSTILSLTHWETDSFKNVYIALTSFSWRSSASWVSLNPTISRLYQVSTFFQSFFHYPGWSWCAKIQFWIIYLSFSDRTHNIRFIAVNQSWVKWVLFLIWNQQSCPEEVCSADVDVAEPCFHSNWWGSERSSGSLAVQVYANNSRSMQAYSHCKVPSS